MSATEMLSIYFGEMFPFVRQVIEGEDRRYRTHGYAGSTVDALDRIDIQLRLIGECFRILLRVNAVHWASIHTCRILGADAWFCDDVCHVYEPFMSFLSTSFATRIGCTSGPQHLGLAW
jgi:hypothetical protein